MIYVSCETSENIFTQKKLLMPTWTQTLQNALLSLKLIISHTFNESSGCMSGENLREWWRL